jgi:hypothetical protein
MAFRGETITRMEKRVSELIKDFGRYVDAFNGAKLFTGPSLYFHHQALEQLRSYDSVLQALNDDLLLERIYATLTAWGMHRMGPIGAKLVDYRDFQSSVRAQATRIGKLEHLRLWDLPEREVPAVAGQLCDIISALQVGEGKTRLVSGSKTLHHLLPELLTKIFKALRDQRLGSSAISEHWPILRSFQYVNEYREALMALWTGEGS